MSRNLTAYRVMATIVGVLLVEVCLIGVQLRELRRLTAVGRLRQHPGLGDDGLGRSTS